MFDDLIIFSLELNEAGWNAKTERPKREGQINKNQKAKYLNHMAE